MRWNEMDKLIKLTEEQIKLIEELIQDIDWEHVEKFNFVDSILDALQKDVRETLIKKLEEKRYFAKSGSGMLVNEGVVTATELLREEI
jgi:Na+/phosphate symporter